jgi:uncharacterized membrane protein YdbT with pleckstrin-like domain
MGYVEKLMGTNEEVLVRERQHVWVWIPRMIVAMIAVSAITVLTVFAAQQTKTQAILLALALNLIPIIWFVSKFIDWMNEEYIVTNRRIVQTEGAINKNVIDSSLEKINDVVLTQSFLGRMLNYGDLEILTASQEGINKLTLLTDPVKFKVAMLNAKEALRDTDEWQKRASAAATSDAVSRADIPRLISELEGLKNRGLITPDEFEAKRKRLLDQI